MHKAGKISSIRLLLHNISEELVTDDVDKLKFLCDDGTLTKARLERIKNARELFVAIGEVVEDEGKKLKFLIKLFEAIGRIDLKSMVEEFQESRKDEIRDTGQHEQNVDGDHGINNAFVAPLQSSSGRHNAKPYAPTEPSVQPDRSMAHHTGPPVQIHGYSPSSDQNAHHSQTQYLPASADNQAQIQPSQVTGSSSGLLSDIPQQDAAGQKVPFSQDSSWKVPLGQDTSWKVPSQQHYLGKLPIQQDISGKPPFQQDTQWKVLLPQDSSWKVPLPQDSEWKVPLAQDTSWKVPLPQDSSWKVPLPQKDTPGKDPLPQDTPGKVPFPQDSEWKVPLSQDFSWKVPSPQDTSWKVPLPQDTSWKVPLQQDTSWKVPVPQDTSWKVPLPQDSKGKVPLPQNWKVPSPQDTPGRVPLPQDSSWNVPLPQDTPGKIPFPQDSEWKVPLSQDSKGKVPLPQNWKVPSPQDTPGRVPLPQDSSWNVPLPQGTPGKVPFPQDSEWKVPLPQDTSWKVPLPQDSKGKVPLPQNWKVPSPQDTPGRVPLPQDSSRNVPLPQGTPGKVPFPQDSEWKVPLSQDFSWKVPSPQDTSWKVPLPQDTSWKVPLPQDTSWKVPLQQDTSWKVPLPQDSKGKVPLPQNWKVPSPQDTPGRVPLPQDSSWNVPLPQDTPGKIPLPQDSSWKVPLSQDSSGSYYPQYSVPFGQQEESPHITEEVELKMEEVNLSESAAKPFDVSALGLESQDPKAPSGVRGHEGSQVIPPERPRDDPATNTSFGEHSTTAGSQENVPVERCISTDFHDAGSQCVHQKCPIEMNYNTIKRYFQHGAKELGKGGFGVVYEGTNTFHGQHVVIKEEYGYHLGQPYSAAQLKREKRVGYIKHPHLMPLYAFSEEKGKPCCLMYPKMHSDLHRALRKDLNGQQKLSWENRVKIALHTARALKYLHTEVKNERNVRQEIVHMDVKPGNIFLDEDFNARLGDPGMAQELPMGFSFASLSQIRGTEGYLDEYLRDRHFKPTNDIFSFGVVMLQLLTQRKAVEVTAPNKNEPLHRVLHKEGALSDPDKLMKKAKKNVWPDGGDDKNYTKEFAAIAIDCLKPPSERAKLSDICKRLEVILERRRVAKASKPKEGSRCVSCLLNHPAKYLAARSSGCDGDYNQECNYFCVTCLTQARRNPLECPCHGQAEPHIGGSDTYAVLICGNDPNTKAIAAVFERDLFGIKSVLTDSRIVGIRRDHIFCIKPQSPNISQAAEVRQALKNLKQKLLSEGKKDVFLYFYFSGHSDQNGNLVCSSEEDILTEVELREHLHLLKDHVSEFLIILDCCYADGKIASEHLEDGAFLVHKSPDPAEETDSPRQQPLESLCCQLYGSEDCEATKEPVSSAAKQLTETDSDTLDGNMFCKAPSIGFTVRQWSSSLGQQQSYGKLKGNSFLTEYIICGLRSAHTCRFAKPNCPYCETFKAQAKSVGFISVANLEDFISKHVKLAARKAGGRIQSPRMRSVHSSETILAYYNEDELCDEIIFKSASEDSERIKVDGFPLTLEEFQIQMFFKVKGYLPNCAQPKHLQILCDDEEILPTSYVDLQDFIRQGYDVRCRLRPCSDITVGPVVLQIKGKRDLVVSLLSSLQLTRNQQEVDTFELDTNQRTYGAEDVKECVDENASLSDLQGTSLVNSIIEFLSMASMYRGLLTVCVLPDSLDCSFEVTT